MLINGIDISTLGAKLYDRVIKTNRVKTAEDWLDGDIQPTFVRQQDSFKSIMLSFLILGNSEEDAFLRISKLTNLIKKSSLVFDDINLTFDVTMIGYGEPERLKNGNFIVTYQLNGDYAKGEREVYTTNSNLTNSFKLTLVYYKNSTSQIAIETTTVRANAFNGTTDTLASIGIDVDKYLPEYYNRGVATNLAGMPITFDNLKSLGTLIINYAPIEFNAEVIYYMGDANSAFTEIVNDRITFTYDQLQSISSIGELINMSAYKPEGYRAYTTYSGDLTVEDILSLSPISVFYEKMSAERTKNVVINYYTEQDDGSYSINNSKLIIVKESDIYSGIKLANILPLGNNPNEMYYGNGFIEGHQLGELITFDDVDISYNIKYPLKDYTIYVEYYYGVYPEWYRINSATTNIKYLNKYAESFNINELSLDVDRYHSSEYQKGVIYNSDMYQSFDDLITSGVVQVYYRPIDYQLQVKFCIGANDPNPVIKTYTINALDFLSNPVLKDIVPINDNKPEGYRLDEDNSYSGDITLQALMFSSPIRITYEEIQVEKTKNIIVKYRKQLASTYSTINTSLITISESDCAGGVRLKDVIDLNAYQPEYYGEGIIDGVSQNALMGFNDIDGTYEVLYLPLQYATSVRYYLNTVDDGNWIGSSVLEYNILDFNVDTTLYDLGFDINAYKPAYAADGELQYTGPVNFVALKGLESLNVTYAVVTEPEDPDGIDYPHRFLFLQHNDMGEYETLYPTWTMNHAYINTGVTAEDMSKLTVVMECDRVDNNVPLHDVNTGYGYLFGSHSSFGSFFMRFNNQTKHGTNLTGVNTYEAKAGNSTNLLSLSEATAIGFGANSGIYQEARDGYSIATFTYSNQLQTENTRMPYPIYLFALNNAGQYKDGLAGIGIYSCRIYYDGKLLRDFVPVQFYDKIGDKVAPSNCLYDKVTQSFFEDGTGKNSFNIIDDDRYIDNNPEHKIGYCYVNYYKDDVLFKTSMVWFRGNDFDKPYDAYAKFAVDAYQPEFAEQGVIEDFDMLTFDFFHMNKQVFRVDYKGINSVIEVRYNKVDGLDNKTELATEQIALTEKDFLQAPTFGDIVRLNKYKPEGYETSYVFPSERVTLKSILANAPYVIDYYKSDAQEPSYTTTIKYYKKVWGVRNYELIGTERLSIPASCFRDGEYIDFYIDFDAMKPEKFYQSGAPYEWYYKDDRLTTPEDLKLSYSVVYNPTLETLPINYYTDELDEDNLIASTSWDVQIDSFNPDEPFYLVDLLPNSFINRYRPRNCGAGMLQNSNVSYTFETLMELKEIAIIYETISEPHDPTEDYYQRKVLYFGDVWNDDISSSIGVDMINQKYGEYFGAKIPYIDLGYRPKEIGRLRTEIICYAKPIGCTGTQENIAGLAKFEPQNFNGIYGYFGAPNFDKCSMHIGSTASKIIFPPYLKTNQFALPNSTSKWSKGYYAIAPRMPEAQSWVYTAEGPQFIDGQMFYTGGSGTGAIAGQPKYIIPGICAQYRVGQQYDTDDNYETIVNCHDYGMSYNYNIRNHETFHPTNSFNGQDGYQRTQFHKLDEDSSSANPFYITMDAYNNYISISTYADVNNPSTVEFNPDDMDLFENREQPKGSLSLFRTTNPHTGKINIMPFNGSHFQGFGQWEGNPGGFSNNIVGFDPYNQDPGLNGGGTASIEVTVESITGYAADGTPIIEKKTLTRNVKYADYAMPQFNSISGAAVWGIKIWDRDRLVRDLIPVAKGDMIYDYVMPDNGLFDKVTEIFFGNSNEGGEYTISGSSDYVVEVKPSDVWALHCIPDPLIYGKITTNYYDYDNTYLGSQFVDIPTWYSALYHKPEDIVRFNDFKPDDFHYDGWLDVDYDMSFAKDKLTLAQLYEMGTANVYYKLRSFTKTVVYYRDNFRVGSKDLFFTYDEIRNAETLEDLGLDVDLYYDPKFKPGRVIFDESILVNNNIQDFIDAPSPIVVYDKLTKEEAPQYLYVEYYRGGAYDNNLITLSDNENYLDCDLTARVLNPYGAIKYDRHYHSALYEDEVMDYFIPYQVRIKNKYAGLHYGPGRVYPTIANIIEPDIYTIIKERNGWGQLKEYRNAWILLSAVEPVTGPGQNPDYTPGAEDDLTIPFGEYVDVTKLTIDRLWAYAPDYDCWLKVEDLSYSQAGKLFNAIGLEVIDLRDVDFTKATNLADVGIRTELYRLRFHESSGYKYNNSYNYANFSELHEIDIVYKEMIYRYTCIYYKENVADVNELGRAGFSCSISDWNPDWDIFLATSRKEDEDGKEIDPTLYRDTELTLNWDYFGFKRNLYKPDGYGDGIYIWNPRTWQVENYSFTFKELIKCGTQYVLYPIIDPGMYKFYTKNNKIFNDENERVSLNRGVDIDLTDDSGIGNMLYRGDSSKEVYDVYVEGEFNHTEGDSARPPRWMGSARFDQDRSNRTNLAFDFCDDDNNPFDTGTIYTPDEMMRGRKFFYNISNYREYPQTVFGYFDDEGQKSFVAKKFDSNKTLITDNLNLEQFKRSYGGEGSGGLYLSIKKHYNYKPASERPFANCIINRVISYKSFLMTHYYIPLPKGFRYRMNGVNKQITENCMFDLLTGKEEYSLKKKDGTQIYYGSNPGEYYTLIADGQDDIYYATDNVDNATPVMFFQDWHYDSTELPVTTRLALANTTKSVDMYVAPDPLSTRIRTVSSWSLIPVEAYTADAFNGVEGEWYKSCDAWFVSNLTTLNHDISSSNLTQFKEKITTMRDESSDKKSVRIFKTPVSDNKFVDRTDYTGSWSDNRVIQSYYNYHNPVTNEDYIYDGKEWIPRMLTSLNVVPENKNWVCSMGITVYQYPIENSLYKVDYLYYGDRFTAISRSVNDPTWIFIGNGWIHEKNNISEVL